MFRFFLFFFLCEIKPVRFFFFSSRRRHTRWNCDWSSDVCSSDLWWASWHTFWPITLAWLLRRPSALIVGGFDTANEPEIGYGYQQGGGPARLSRWIMRRADVLATNSAYSREEIERNTGISRDRVTVMHHGVPDPFGALPVKPAEPLALTVGNVDRPNLERKGLRAFAEAAAELPDVEFVLAGRFVDDAGEALRARAPA